MELEQKRNSQIKTPAALRFQKELRLNFEILAQEIVKQLRGSVSQRDLSERLGYSFNQVGKWESGVTQIKWDDFLLLCRALNIPLEMYFRYSFGHQGSEFNSSSTLKTLMDKFNLRLKKDTASRALVRKWADGSSVPPFSQVLKIIGSKSAVLFGWLSLFLNCKNIASFKDTYPQFITNVEVVLENPIVVYVNAALQLRAYQDLKTHNERLLAEHSACTIEELRTALSILMDNGLASFDGKKYHPSIFDFGFSSLRHPKLRGLTKNATCLAAARYPESPIFIDPLRTPNPSVSSVRITALSAEAAQKISDLIVNFHNQIDDIVNADHRPKDNVQILLVHSFASNINSPKVDEATVDSFEQNELKQQKLPVAVRN